HAGGTTEISAKAGQASKPNCASSTASSSTWNWPSAPRTCSCSVVITRHERAALADQEIQIRAFVRLQHVVEVKAPVAALERRFGRLPFFPALGELLVGYVEVQAALRHVELDGVAVLHQ